MTLDELITALEAKKREGTEGTTPVVVRALDNNGRQTLASRDVDLIAARLDKSEFDKAWPTCKLVSRAGVPALLIG